MLVRAGAGQVELNSEWKIKICKNPNLFYSGKKSGPVNHLIGWHSHINCRAGV